MEKTKYTKAELLAATNLTGKQRDMLVAALDNKKKYTIAAAKTAIAHFKGGLF